MLAPVIERLRQGWPNEAKLLRQSGLFDEVWYNEKYPAVGDQPRDAIERYLALGVARGDRPHPLFDVPWYVARNPDAATGQSPLAHFILVGAARGASPTPLFDPEWYRQQAGERLRGASAFRHFLHEGSMRGLSPHPVFDGKAYLAANPQFSIDRINPLTHYVEIGVSQGYAPNAYFDGRWYVDEYPEVARQGFNPLAHFIAEGVAKGYRPHPQIDLERYSASTPDCPKEPAAAYIHLVTVARKYEPVADDRQTPSERRLKQQLLSAAPSRPRRVPPMPAVVDPASFAPLIGSEDLLPPAGMPGTGMPIVEAAEGARLVTFDVWDTLLRRDCHPDEVKLQSARYLLISSFILLRQAFWDLATLFRARQAAEAEATVRPGEDCLLEDALALWLSRVLKPEIYHVHADRLRAALLDHELTAERRGLRADSGISGLLPLITAPKVFVSDFYMPEASVRKLLAEADMDRFFVKGYVSAEVGATKRDGQLFDQVLKDFAEDPPDILHVGDRREADIEAAQSRGIEALHYELGSEQRRQEWYGNAFEARLQGDLAPHSRRVMALLEGLAQQYQTDLGDDRRAAGVRLAPLFVSFVLRILTDAIGRNVDRVFFFRREGVFLSRLYEAVREADPFNMKSAPSVVLDVSRSATFAASIESLTPQELMRLWSLYDTQSFEALALSLNLSEELARASAGAHGLEYRRPVARPWQDKAFCAALADAPLRKHAEARFREQRQRLRAYLREAGFSADLAKEQLLVDIGWRGTIQDNLEIVTGQKSVGHYLGLFRYLSPQGKNSVKVGWLGNENDGGELGLEDVAPFEALCSCPGGSVVEYDSDGQSVQPRRVSLPQEDDVIRHQIAPIQEGVLAAVPALCDYVRLHGLTAEDLLPLARALAHGLMESPPSCIADAFFALPHNERFGNGEVYDFGANDLVRDLEAASDSAALHAAAQETLSKLRWPSAIGRRSEVVTWAQSAETDRRHSLPTRLFVAQLPPRAHRRDGTLCVYAPAPLRASGGQRTLYRLVGGLAALGFEPHVMVDGQGDGPQVVESYLGSAPASYHSSWQTMPCDLALASTAQSAHVVAGLPSARHRAYLVQDFEASFLPMSDSYLRAESSYGLGLRHLTIGSWLPHLIGRQFGAAAAAAGLGVDHAVYRPLPDEPRETAICALYQPEKPRRAPDIVADALQIVSRRFPNVKIFSFGSPHRLPFEGNIEHLGPIEDLQDLNRLYNRCIAGVCLSSSNPSRVPYEMMAAGCIPVDLYRYNNLFDHRDGCAVLAYQSPASIAAALEMLLVDSPQAARRRSACIEFVLPRTEQWETDVLLNHLLEMVAGEPPPRGAAVRPSYHEAPVIAREDETAAIYQFCDWQRQQAGASW
jgi:FMN phosphatase YigB (HAD superfamily)